MFKGNVACWKPIWLIPPSVHTSCVKITFYFLYLNLFFNVTREALSIGELDTGKSNFNLEAISWFLRTFSHFLAHKCFHRTQNGGKVSSEYLLFCVIVPWRRKTFPLFSPSAPIEVFFPSFIFSCLPGFHSFDPNRMYRRKLFLRRLPVWQKLIYRVRI